MKKKITLIIFLSFFYLNVFASREISEESDGDGEAISEQVFIWKSTQFFNADEIEESKYLSLLPEVLKEMATKNKTIAEILIEFNLLLENSTQQIDVKQIAELSNNYDKWDTFAEKIDIVCIKIPSNDCDKIQNLDEKIHPNFKNN